MQARKCDWSLAIPVLWEASNWPRPTHVFEETPENLLLDCVPYVNVRRNMAETLQIAPADLLLDSENPRLSQSHIGQRQTLQEMAKLLQRKLATMAGDIVQHGLDPSTIPIVVRHSGTPTRYVILEGNRRLAAIRALENPESVAPVVKTTVLSKLRQHSRSLVSG